MSHVASSCGIMDVFGDMVDMWEQLNFTNVKPEGKDMPKPFFLLLTYSKLKSKINYTV